MMTFAEFAALADHYNVITLTRTGLADLHTPVSAYLALRQTDAPSFLLESAEANEKIGRYSFIGVDPCLLVQARGPVVKIVRGREVEERREDIFQVLHRLSAEYRCPAGASEPGLRGGFVGYIGYDCVQHLEAIRFSPPRFDEEPDALFGLFATVVRFDHRRHRIAILHNVLVEKGQDLRRQYETARQKLETLELRLRNAVVPPGNFRCDPNAAREDLDAASFRAAVRRAQQHIREGDIFQVVLSRKTRLSYAGDPFSVYRTLRSINPSPYLFFMDFGETKLIGSSPEMLVRAGDGEAELFPIAGTRPRGRTEEEDERLARELSLDEKEGAEHLMLVDLGRNDLGRVSEYGSVQVPVLRKVEKYSHVMHLVSQVRGKLKAGTTGLEALRACFPAGTVTGAPKVRAMQIISNLEPGRRGAYGGAVGYFGFDGRLDFCLAIRTLIAHHGTLSIQAGAGIVADSDPEREYQETVNKAQALLEAVALAGGDECAVCSNE